MKNPATLKELPDYERSGLRSDVAESKGFDLRCGAGRLGLQSAPGALLRALGFESQRFLLYAKAPVYDGSFCVWRRVRDSTCAAAQAASGCKAPPALC